MIFYSYFPFCAQKLWLLWHGIGLRRTSNEWDSIEGWGWRYLQSLTYWIFELQSKPNHTRPWWSISSALLARHYLNRMLNRKRRKTIFSKFSHFSFLQIEIKFDIYDAFGHLDLHELSGWCECKWLMAGDFVEYSSYHQRLIVSDEFRLNAWPITFTWWL